MNELGKIYRLQISKTGLSTTCPRKRVVINHGDGTIHFNPNEKHYIYFSRQHKHHSYYAFKKFQQNFESVITALGASGKKHYTMADLIHFMASAEFETSTEGFYEKIDSIGLSVLPSFLKFSQKCCESNRAKFNPLAPERSDMNLWGGAYGFSGDWLALLRASTIKIDVSQISFEEYLAYARKLQIKHCTKDDSRRYKFLDGKIPSLSFVTDNVSDQNSTNLLTRYVKNIHKKMAYTLQDKSIDDNFFDASLREMKSEFRDTRERVL